MMINPLLSIFGTRSIFITAASSASDKSKILFGFALNCGFILSLTAHKAIHKHSSFCRNTENRDTIRTLWIYFLSSRRHMQITALHNFIRLVYWMHFTYWSRKNRDYTDRNDASYIKRTRTHIETHGRRQRYVYDDGLPAMLRKRWWWWMLGMVQWLSCNVFFFSSAGTPIPLD